MRSSQLDTYLVCADRPKVAVLQTSTFQLTPTKWNTSPARTRIQTPSSPSFDSKLTANTKQAFRPVSSTTIIVTRWFELSTTCSRQTLLTTYAQIIDGLPTADMGFDRRSHRIWDGYTVEKYVESCPGAMEKAREFCPRWHLEMLVFSP